LSPTPDCLLPTHCICEFCVSGVHPAFLYVAAVRQQPVAQGPSLACGQFLTPPGKGGGGEQAILAGDPGRGIPGIVRMLQEGKPDGFALHDADAAAPGGAASVNSGHVVAASAVAQM